MENTIYVIFASKLMEMCGGDNSASFYAAIPLIDKKPGYFSGIYAHSLENQPRILDSAIEIFTGKRMDVAKNSYEYKRIKEEKDAFINILSLSQNFLKTKNSGKITGNKIDMALSIISHIYFDIFIHPIQFFIPHSSSCSGQWNLWDKIDYLLFREKINDKQKIFDIRNKLLECKVWKTTFKPDDFPLIVKRRLLKEKAFDKKLDPNSMIKAMIIRMGELAKPSINYEIIDFSVRSFFTYLGAKHYLRVDREIEFLRRFEEEMKRIIVSLF